MKHPSYLSRRNVVLGGLASVGSAALVSPRTILAATDEAPKSTHTWLGLGHKRLYNFDVDMRIDTIPSPLNPRWLYFPSLQVNFEKHDEWAHGGVQWAGGRKKINWGGGSDTGYGKSFDGKEMSILQEYDWDVGTWYRYRVWRVNKDETGYNRWLFTIKNYATGQEKQIGSLRTFSDWITGAVVWIETGYGVVCDTEPVRISWRNPVYRGATPGLHQPTSGTTSYNGTCTGTANSNQWLTGRDPLQWVQATNTPRTTPHGTKLWG